MNVIWHKIRRDLTLNKFRTGLIATSTAMGVFALGLVLSLSDVMRTRMAADHLSSVPAHLTFLPGPYDADVIDVISQQADIAAVTSETRASVRWRIQVTSEPQYVPETLKESGTEWRTGNLIARPDYIHQPMNRIQLQEGAWPSERTLAMEQQASDYFGIPAGMEIVVEFGRSERRLPVSGLVRDSTVVPPIFGGDATFYTTPDTIAWLAGIQRANRLYLRLQVFDPLVVDRVAKQVQERLMLMGLPEGGYSIADPAIHPLQEMVDTLSLILTALSMLLLALSAFLIVNMTNALIVQQVWQIGIMKVVGATFGRILFVYLIHTLAYGVLALLLAVPAAAVATHLLSRWLLGLVNIAGGPFHLVPLALLVQAAVALFVPVLAALAPLIGGARITPRQAISSYGLGGSFGSNWLDRLISKIRFLPRPLTLSLRNTFRRQVRVAWTLLTLILSGVLIIAVMSVNASLNRTLEVLIGEYGLDVWAVLSQPYRAAYLSDVTRNVPGVLQAEVWDQRPAMLSLADGQQYQIYAMGLPPESQLFHPRIVAGRSLLPGDGRAILLNVKVALEEAIGVGQEIELEMDGRTSYWTVVGLVLSVSNEQRDCFVPLETLAREIGQVGQGTVVMVLSDRHDAAGQETLIRNLRAEYKARHIQTAFFLSSHQIRTQSQAQFRLITSLMLALAVLAAVVGSIGLMGTVSVNVVERSREFGMMRAIGATSFHVMGIVVTEGVLIGVLSWLFAIPISYPGAEVLSDLVGSTLLDVPLDFSYSLIGASFWLAAVIVLSALASLWPAWRASTISVRQVLAYE